MSSFNIPFATANRAIAAPSLAYVRMEAWSLTALLLVCTGVLWMGLAWLTGLWQLAVFLFSACAVFALPQTVTLQGRIPLLLSFSIPLWGTLQMLLGRAAYNYVALQAVLSWSIFPAFMLLGLILLREYKIRDTFLSSLWFLSLAITGLELCQILVLGRYTLLPSGYPLMSSNLYAELAELLLPAVLATAIRKGGHLWLGCSLTALMVGTAVAAGARMGTALLLLEIGVVFWSTQRTPGYRTLALRKHGIALAALVLLALALEGTTGFYGKVRQQDDLSTRPRILHSALDMVRQHPVIGFGLGSFATVYPAFDHLNSPYTVNHVHNDYLEIAAESGAVGLLLWLVTLGFCIPSVLKTPWALGTLAILLHGFTDFPLYRLPVVALAALLFAAANARNASAQKKSLSRQKLLSSKGGLQSSNL